MSSPPANVPVELLFEIDAEEGEPLMNTFRTAAIEVEVSGSAGWSCYLK